MNCNRLKAESIISLVVCLVASWSWQLVLLSRFMASLGSYWFALSWYLRSVSFYVHLLFLYLCSYIWVCVILMFVCVLCLITMKVFTYSPKRSTSFQLLMRFMQGIASLGLVAALCLTVAFTDLSIPDLFASFLAFIATGWTILSVSWKGLCSIFCIEPHQQQCLKWKFMWWILLHKSDMKGLIL